MTIIRVLLLLFLFTCQKAIAGNNDSANHQGALRVTYAVLPNDGYSFADVVTNNNLPFTTSGVLQSFGNTGYWLKISLANPNRLSGRYNMYVDPAIYNTIYYFDPGAQKWLSNAAGETVPRRSIKTQIGALFFLLNNQPVNTVYVKMDLNRLKKNRRAIKPVIMYEDAAETEKNQDALVYGWVAALAVLFFFFLYNLYLYWSFREASVLFYLVAQVGAMIYITGYRWIFKVFLPNKVFNLIVLNDSSISSYDIDNILQHAGIVLVVYGLVQLTRNYLNTKNYLPVADKVLKYGLYIYLTVSVILIITNTVFFYVEYYTLLYDNMLLLLVILAITGTCIAGYRRKLRASGPFLLANILPLAIIAAITIFHVAVSLDDSNDVWLPSLAIVSQAFCFSVAVVTRTKLIQSELMKKEMEAQQLSFEIETINIKMLVDKANTQLLQERLEANQRELASTTLYLVQKNEMMAVLRNQIEELNRLYPKNIHGKLSGMEAILQSSFNLDDDWQKFKLHFELVNPGFFENLAVMHPSLTKNEIRLYAYFHINLSAKEIASLLNIEPDSVRRAKSRLLKKMGLSDNADAGLVPDQEQ